MATVTKGKIFYKKGDKVRILKGVGENKWMKPFIGWIFEIDTPYPFKINGLEYIKIKCGGIIRTVNTNFVSPISVSVH